MATAVLSWYSFCPSHPDGYFVIVKSPWRNAFCLTRFQRLQPVSSFNISKPCCFWLHGQPSLCIEEHCWLNADLFRALWHTPWVFVGLFSEPWSISDAENMRMQGLLFGSIQTPGLFRMWSTLQFIWMPLPLEESMKRSFCHSGSFQMLRNPDLMCNWLTT